MFVAVTRSVYRVALGVLLLLLGATLCYAQGEVSFEVEVSRMQAPVGSRINVEFVLAGARRSRFVLPKLDGLTVVSGPNTTSQYTIVNGRTSSAERIGYELRVEREGPLSIGAATVRAGREYYSTKPVALTGLPQAAVRAGGPLTEDRPVRLEVLAERDTIYEGEQTFVDLQLYARRRLYTYRTLEPLRLDGVRAEDLQRFESRQEPVEVAGEPASRATLERYVVHGSRPGAYTLGPARVRAFVLAGDGRRRGFFLDPRTDEYDVKSSLDTLHVRALPAGAPADFSGVVGRWRWQGVYEDIDDLTTAEALTFKLYAQGRGDVQRLSAPELTWPEGWRAYPPELILDEVVESDTGVVYTRAYAYTVAPERGGQSILQPGLSYFDTEREGYVRWEAPQRAVNVEQVGAVYAPTDGAGAADAEAPMIYEGAPRLLDREDVLPPWFWWVVLLGPLLPLGAWALRRVLDLRGAGAETKELDPLAEGRRRLAAARAQLANPVAFYREVRTALERYAEERLGLPASAQSAAAIEAAFAKTGEPERATRFLEARALADRGLYGGGTDEAGRAAALAELERLLA